MPRFTISIAVHNQSEMTERCIKAIAQHSTDYEIILIDNGSDPHTQAFLEQCGNNPSTYGEIHLIRFPVNRGFGAAHNAALQVTYSLPSSMSNYFVVLNNDVLIGQDGWLQMMAARFAQNPKLAICGVKNTCCYLDSQGLGTPHGVGPPDYVEASCLMMPLNLAQGMRLFSEEFRFAYCEDADLSLRARALGYQIDHVLFTMMHIGAVTARAVEHEIDLEGYRIRNHHLLMHKWADYFRQRSFYQQNIVIRRTGAVGDVIMATAAVRALSSRLPQAKITVVTYSPEVFAGNPHVEMARQDLNLAAYRNGTCQFFDLDMAYEKQSLKPAIWTYLQACGITDIQPWDWQTSLYPSKKDWEFAEQALSTGHSWVLIHPGLIPGWVGRQWKVENFWAVAEELRARGFRVAVVGDRSTPLLPSDADLRARPLGELAACMGKAKLFFGLDSMPMHVAQAMKTPLVAIFGCVDPALRLIPGSESVGLTAKNVGCLGCHNWLPGPRTATTTCLRGAQMCMEKLTVQEVIEAVILQIRSPQKVNMQSHY